MSIDQSRALFVRLLTQNERRVYGYILSMVVDWNDADDILQETNVRLWEEFGRFEPGTNFAAWAIRVAHYQVLTWRKRRDRSRLVFSEEAIALLADEPSAGEDADGVRRAALAECMKQLSVKNRDLLTRCYSGVGGIRDLAGALGRTTEAVYKMLQRVRHSLHRCIEKRLAMEDA